MDSGKFRALIVGGGIGGLCLAQGLKQAGIAFTVFERDPAPTSRLQGYRLSLTPGGSLALRTNLPDALWERIEQARTPQMEGISFVSEKLELRFFKKTPPPIDTVRRFGSISRVTLREILLTNLADSVAFGKRLVRYELLPDQTVRCFFADGSTEEGHLLVGADGTNSSVREQFLPFVGRVELGASAIAAQVALDETTRRDLLPPPLGETAVVIDENPQGMFLTSHELDAQEGGESYVFWSFLTDRSRFPSDLEAMSAQDLIHLTDEMTVGWHPRLKNLIRRANPQTAQALNFRTSIQPDRWPSGSVTLVGDAIHSMPPTGGMGANMALEDAATLCETLVEYRAGRLTLYEAVDAYESKMFAYAFPAVEDSMNNLRRMVVRNRDASAPSA